MKKIKSIFIAGLISIGGIGSASAEDGSVFAAENFSATLTFTTDYTFRGTTFSVQEPAIQGSFDWAYGPFFAGMWGTSLDNQNQDKGFAKIAGGGELEIDYYVGWADTLGGVDLMIMPLIYTFPGQDSPNARDDFTFELWTSIGRGFEYFPGSPYVSVAFNYSPEYFDNGENAYYVKPSIAFALPHDFGIDFAYGYQDVDGVGGNDFFPDDYAHIEIGLSKSALGFDFDLRYHDNLDASTIGANFALDQEVVFSVSRSF